MPQQLRKALSRSSVFKPNWVLHRATNRHALIRNYDWYAAHRDEYRGKTGISHRLPWEKGALNSLSAFSRSCCTTLDKALAAAAGLGRAGRLAEHLARISERIERTAAVEVERIVSGRQFRPREKRATQSQKTKRGKGTKWMVVVDGASVRLGDHLHSAYPAEEADVASRLLLCADTVPSRVFSLVAYK